MVRLQIKYALQFITIVIALFSMNSVHASCKDYYPSIAELNEQIQSLSASSFFLEQYMRGKIVEDKPLTALFNVPVDNETKVSAAIKLLQKQLNNIETPLAMSAEYKAKQAELVASHIAKQDIVITTALIPGRPAPRLITKEMVTLNTSHIETNITSSSR